MNAWNENMDTIDETMHNVSNSIPTNNNQLENGAGYITKNVNNLTNYSKTANSASTLLLSVNTQTYVMTLQLKAGDGTVMSTQTVDLPLDTMVVDASYNSQTKEITLTLQNGNTVSFSIADLVSGLVPDGRKIAGVNLVDDITKNELLLALNVADGAQVNVLEGITVNGVAQAIVNKIVNIPNATTSASGAMSATDKSKLDNIENGAQVNVLEGVQVDGTDLEISSKKVNIVGIADIKNRLDVLEDISVLKEMTWDNIKIISDKGQARNYFAVGDELTEDWKSTISGEETSYENVPMYISHMGNVTVQDDGSDVQVPGMFMEWKYTLPFAIPFCAPQCLQCFDGTDGAPDGLPAGKYAFKVKSLPNWATAKAAYQGKYLCFTLTQAIPSGGVLTGSGWGNNNTWAMQTKTSYLNTGTVIETPEITVEDTLPNDCTYLGETWSNDVGYGILNWCECVPYGDNTWRDSDLRQWLNSNAEAGQWWTKKTRYNMQPAAATTHAGFLNGYSNDFISNLKTTKVAQNTNTVKEKEGMVYTYDKIFIASRTQMNCNTNDEGEIWDYYKELAVGEENLDASGRFKAGQTYAILKRYGLGATTTAYTFFNRSAYRAHGNDVYGCNSSGNLTNNNAGNSYRCLPACVI